jgi:hypothetical protein
MDNHLAAVAAGGIIEAGEIQIRQIRGGISATSNK